MTQGQTFTQTTGYLRPGDLTAAYELARQQIADMKLDYAETMRQMTLELKAAWDEAVYLPPLLKQVPYSVTAQDKVREFFACLELFKPDDEPNHAIANKQSWAGAKLQASLVISTESRDPTRARELFDKKAQGAWVHVARAYALMEQCGRKRHAITQLKERADAIIGLPMMM